MVAGFGQKKSQKGSELPSPNGTERSKALISEKQTWFRVKIKVTNLKRSSKFLWVWIELENGEGNLCIYIVVKRWGEESAWKEVKGLKL